jgi:hypothetical protein
LSTMKRVRFDLVSAADIDRIIESKFSPSISDLGFVYVSRRKWVRSRAPGIRDLVVIQALKSANYYPIIGFSLDYVPHISGNSMRWHRTEKSAQFDLKFDPLDIEVPGTVGFDQWMIHNIRGKSVARQTAKDVGRLVAGEIRTTLDEVENNGDLCEAFEAQIARETVRFSFFNYTHQPLAYAFTLLRAGNIAKAELMFDRWNKMMKERTDAVNAIEDLFYRERKEFSSIISDA